MLPDENIKECVNKSFFFVISTEAEASAGTGGAEDSLPFAYRPRISGTG